MFKRHKVWAVSGFFPAPKSYVQLVITLQLQRKMGCYLSTGHGPDSVLMDLFTYLKHFYPALAAKAQVG